MKRRYSTVLLFALVMAACSRGVSVGSSAPGSAYSVMVANSTGVAMDVSYNDGSDHALGSVDAGRTQRFVVAGSKQSTVSITGRSQTGRSSGPYQVSLSASSSPTVTLR